MTNPTADAANLLRDKVQQILSPAIDPRSPYARVLLDKLLETFAEWNTRPQPTPPEGEPDFQEIAREIAGLCGKHCVPYPGFSYHPVYVADTVMKPLMSLLRKYLGLPAWPKVEDADVARVVGFLRASTNDAWREAQESIADLLERLAAKIKALNAALSQAHWDAEDAEARTGVHVTGSDIAHAALTLAAQLAEANERTVSVSFPNHPLRGGVEREYTLDDIEPLLQRAEAAEAKLAEREAKLAKADAALAIMDDFVQPNIDWEEWISEAFEEAQGRHAARQQQKASAEKDKP